MGKVGSGKSGRWVIAAIEVLTAGALFAQSAPTADLFTNVNDILTALANISGAAIRPSFQRANLLAISSADPCLNAFVNTADVQIAVRAVTGDSYGPPATGKIVDPALCPVCP